MINKIFLSAGIPQNEDVDRISIRDSVIKLCDFAYKEGMQIVHGGHPAIVSLLSSLVKMDNKLRDYILIYQSASFGDKWKETIEDLNTFVLFGKMSQEEAVEEIRLSMLEQETFVAGVFIGGGEGVKKEFNLFHSLNPNATLIPLGSTGGAAEYLHKKLSNVWDIKEEYNYLALYKKLIKG